MPITADEFDRGERTVSKKERGEPTKKVKKAPTSHTTRKTVAKKGQIKAYGQYGQKKFFVAFLEGPDNKAMFQESHWGKFQSGDVIEFESKYNPESFWHGIHKNHFVRVVENKFDAEGEVEITIDVGYVTKWKEDEDGIPYCMSYLKEPIEGVASVKFTEGTTFNDNDFDYARCRIFGKRDNGSLIAETVEVLEKKKMYYTHDIQLSDLTYYDGAFSYVMDDFQGIIEAEWACSELNKDKSSIFGEVHIRGNYRMHGRFFKDDFGEWQERVWYMLDSETSKFDINEEYLDYIKEIMIESKVAKFIGKVRQQINEGELDYMGFDEIIKKGKEEGIYLSEDEVRGAFWKVGYDERFWEALAKTCDGVYVSKGMFIFTFGKFQVFETPKLGVATYVFQETPGMDLHQKVKKFAYNRKGDIRGDGELGTDMGYFMRVIHDYLGLWKMNMENIIQGGERHGKT